MKQQMIERRARPRDGADERATALRGRVMEALGTCSRTTKQVVACLGEDSQVVYRALLALQTAGTVTSVREHHLTENGVPGRIWRRTDAPSSTPVPPQDPLLWALFRKPESVDSASAV